MASYNFEYNSASSDRKRSDLSNDDSKSVENSARRLRKKSSNLNLKKSSTLTSKPQPTPDRLSHFHQDFTTEAQKVDENQTQNTTNNDLP